MGATSAKTTIPTTTPTINYDGTKPPRRRTPDDDEDDDDELIMTMTMFFFPIEKQPAVLVIFPYYTLDSLIR